MPKRSDQEFTDKFVSSARARNDVRTSYFDRLTPGLELRVSTEGAKAWAYRYRNEAGRSVRYSIGAYPSIKLKDARDIALELRGKVSRGGDPNKERRVARAAAKAQRIKTLGDLADAYLEHAEANQRASTVSVDRQRLKSHIRPKLGALPVETVTRAQVRELVNDLIKRGHGVTGNRVGGLIGRMYRFADRELDLSLTNPAQGMQTSFAETSRDRTLTDDELKALWTAWSDPSDGAPLSPAMARCLKLCILTLQRANEVAGMHDRELDLGQRLWIIPGVRSKNGREHVVPLSEAAIAEIKAAQLLRPRQENTGVPVSRFVFASPRRPAKPLTRHALTRAMSRTCEALRDQQREEFLAAGGDAGEFTPSLLDATPHDLRRTGSTQITSERIGIPRFTVSLVLGHRSETGGVTGVYDRNAYLSEKRRALDAWARLLLEIVGAERGERSALIAAMHADNEGRIFG